MPYQLYGSFKGYQRATLIILSLDEIYCTEKSAHVFQSKNRILQRKKSIPLAFVSVSEFACLRVLSFLRESVTRPRMVKGWQIELKRRTDWVKQSQRQKKRTKSIVKVIDKEKDRHRNRETEKEIIYYSFSFFLNISLIIVAKSSDGQRFLLPLS